MAWIYLMFIIFNCLKYVQAESCGYVNGSMLQNHRYGLHFEQSEFFRTDSKSSFKWIWEKSHILTDLNDTIKYQKSPGKLIIQHVSSLDQGQYYVECWVNGTTYQSNKLSLAYGNATKGNLTTQTTKTRKSRSTSTTTPWTPTITVTLKTTPSSKGSTASQTTDAATPINQPESTQMQLEMTPTANTNNNKVASSSINTDLNHTMTTFSTTENVPTSTSCQVTSTTTSIQNTETETDNPTSTGHHTTTTMSSNEKEWILSQTTIIVISVGAVLVTLIVSLTVCISIMARRNEKSVSIGSNQPHAIYSTVNRPRYRNTTNGTPLAQNTVANQYAIFNIESANCLNGISGQSPLNNATDQTSVPSPSSVHYASVKRSLHPKPNIADHVDYKTTEQDSQRMTYPTTREQQVPELHYADLDLPAASRNIVQIKKEHDVNRCQYSDVDVHKIP